MKFRRKSSPVDNQNSGLQLSRRQFVINSLSSVSALVALKYSPLGQIAKSFAGGIDGPGRQWYIQISEPAPSGWDMWFWLHASNPAWTDPQNFANNAYNLANKRYGGGDLTVNFDGWPLAPGAQYWSQSGYNPLNQMVLFQGVRSGGSHGDINETQRGSTALYAENLSRIVANHLDGHDKTLLGHTGIPSTVYTPNRLLSAPIMTPLASQQDWQFLTTSSSSGLPDTESSIVDAGVRALGGSGLLGAVSRTSSKNLYNTVLGAFNNSVDLSKTNHANSKPFVVLWKQYFLALYDTLNWLNQHSALKTMFRQAGASGSAQFYCEGVNTSPFYICSDITGMAGIIDRSVDPNMSDAQFAADPTISMILSGNWGSGTQADMVGKAWRYALTEFLIKNNLTKVVDLTVSGADSHGSAGLGLYSSAFVMGGLKQLIANLSATQVPNAPPGTTFLDRTLVSCHSDFIRTCEFMNEGGWGTNHGPSITIPLFGHGATPSVVGAIGLGSDCPLFGGLVSAPMGNPVAVNTSGHAAAGGTIIEKGHVLPTIAAILNAPVPLNQATEFQPVTAVVNKFRIIS